MNATWFFRCFCVLLFGGAALFAIINPPFQVPDEAGHFSRAFEISRGMCFPPSTLAFPKSYREDLATFHGRLEIDPIVASGRLLRTEVNRFRFFDPTEPAEDGYVDPSENVYVCILYAPAALGLEIVRPFGPSAIAALLAARLTAAFICGFIIVAGFRLMPFAKEVYAFVSLLPMQLHQLGSCSADSVVISLALFTTALLLRLGVRRVHTPLSQNKILSLLALSVAIGVAKIDILLLGLLAVIPTSRFGSIRRRVVVSTACFAVALGTLALAPRLAGISSATLAQFNATQNIRNGPNVLFLLHHPLAMTTNLIATLRSLGPHYLTELFGTFGWLSFELPFPIVEFAVVSLTVLSVRAIIPSRSRTVVHVATCSLAVVAFFSVFIALFITAEHFDQLPSLVDGWTVVSDIQGRYFLPFLLLAALALGMRKHRNMRIDRFLCLFSSGTSLVLSLLFLAESFNLKLT